MIFDDYDLDPLIARSDDDFTCPLPPLSQRLRALLAPRPTLKLLDLSRFQLGEVTDVQAIKDAGYVGVILQDDSAFSSLWPIFLYGGMVVITYHLFHAEQSGIDQAHKHMEIVYPLWQAQGARYPALDDIEVRDRIAIPVRQARAEDWRAEIAKETRAGTYCSPCLWEELMDNIPLGDQIGWDACWNSSDEPTLPVGWTREKTLFRQIGVSRKHSWVEIVPGMAGDVDCNVFYGNLTDLYNLGGVNPPPNGEPPMTAIDDLKAFRQNLSTSVLELDSIIAELEATPPSGHTASRDAPAFERRYHHDLG